MVIPKSNNSSTFEEFIPLSLCNTTYKINSKIIAHHLKNILSNHIYQKQFRFLKLRQIHDVIGLAQEGPHSMDIGHQKTIIDKMNLSKAFNKFSWLCLQLLLIHLGFFHPFVTWIMHYINFAFFALLINGSATPFFNVEIDPKTKVTSLSSSLPPHNWRSKPTDKKCSEQRI